MNTNLLIDKLITIDDTGMPVAPNARQLLDKDVRELYKRDKTSDKSKYVKDCIVIYYLGDPKSPAKQSGLSDAEALKMAIEQADLPKTYTPDALVIKLIKRYHEQNISEAGRVVENILKSLHNINLVLDVTNQLLNEKVSITTDLSQTGEIMDLIDRVIKRAGELPKIMKNLEEAQENLMYERETQLSRGGQIVSSSMDAEAYLD